MPTFKRSRSGDISPAQIHFNNTIAKLRVASEHCNSMLKGRFGSLRELRLVISDVQSAAHVCAWIAVCIVIHNFLIVERSCANIGLDGGWPMDDNDGPLASKERVAELDSGAAQRRTALFEEFVVVNDY